MYDKIHYKLKKKRKKKFVFNVDTDFSKAGMDNTDDI